MKKTIQNVLLLFVTISLTLLLLEIFVKFSVSTPRFNRQLNDIWYLGVPNSEGIYRTTEFETHYRFNSIGFRDYEHSVEKPQNICRIAVLGDSFAESMEVELNETWPHLLQEKLNDNLKDKKFEVLNFGMSGGGTSNEYFVLERYALQYKPDIVILAFFNGNDINDNYIQPTGKHFRLDERGNIVEVAQSPGSVLRKILRNSDLVVFMKKNYDLTMLKISKNGLMQYYGVFLADYSHEWNEAWNVTEKALAKIDDTSSKNNAVLLVAVANAKEQINPNLWKFILESRPELEKKEWDLKKPNKMLSGICRRNKITCIDSFEAFSKSYEAGIDPHFSIDKHWNSHGHKLFAENIAGNINGIAKSCGI